MVALGTLPVRVEPPVTVLLAVLLDAVIGEPPETIHPVAIFGRAIAGLDRRWPSPRLVGLAIATLAPVSVAALAWLAVSALPRVVGTVLAGLLLFSSISLRRLLGSARAVIDATETHPGRARERIPALVGRNPEPLSSPQLRSGAVESLAENLADGYVGPLLAFVVGAQLSLSVGIAAAVWVKAVNTLDSMLGYHEKPIGWASARLDDIVMWLPARLTAVILAVAGGRPGALWRARQFRTQPSSPNSGWPMATLAVVLDVRLEKPGVYVLHPDAQLPDGDTATAAIPVVAIAGAIAGLVSMLLVAVPIVPESLFAMAVGVARC
ncbi:cobalamin biosynthesis protein CobD [Halorhabdus sp. CBA1104]|uniref:adenosylcobinamide-phosphate synthase CbiB n=1 Tax=Halorhabdus sp. CBA1104 TaxID=1380432 RepID=UPI0012B316AF|nr:adenosylcobinamide-phosphate synthase CbiB [Halorhabdus sp. CBA1104]QGN08227.1 cobalamin biosynthesis protein CobD [Halorhabdus sp. CBA1104]